MWQNPPCQCQHTDDTVHRGADLVRHTGQEAGFGLAFFFHLAQAVFVPFDLIMQLSGTTEAYPVIRTVCAAGCISVIKLV